MIASKLKPLLLLLCVVIVTQSCKTKNEKSAVLVEEQPAQPSLMAYSDVDDQREEEQIIEEYKVNASGQDISTRFPVPEGYERVLLKPTSFGAFLRQLKLKADGSEVKTYNGLTKTNNGVYWAVVDLPIGQKNLHQCADAVMRLRADSSLTSLSHP